MAKLDEVKEMLTSLRVGLSIVAGLLVVIVGSTIKLERNKGYIMSTILMVSVILIVVASFYYGFNQLTTIET
ncbi:hypothetical protein JHD48_03440 [Sulfurimonas sp. SAG-AH-194-I05]|nr:hypothetical protein [Sulfurimonas sp. SAG-AH-194-I05]MDF1874788.1 hypothetical protein [Sulfurimonas sp. SAG-AH-194-I05]